MKIYPRLLAVTFIVTTTILLIAFVWKFGLLRIAGHGQASPATPSVVNAGQDRSGLRHYMGRGTIALDAKVSTADSQGKLFLWEISVNGKTGPGRHVHLGQDEWFYVLEGEFVAEVGEERFFLHPGDSIMLPRGVPHAYAHLSDGAGKMLGAVLPAGSFEQFLEEATQGGISLTPEEMQRLFRKHGLEDVGRPIDVATLEQDEMNNENQKSEAAAESATPDAQR
jgi:quercetin dioxygenase-like cupin family protein